MTRFVRFAAAALLCAVLLVSCARQNDPPAVPFAGEQLYALAYLGYQTPERLDDYRAEYLGGATPPTHYVSDGDYYLIIPRDGVDSVRLYRNDIETDSSALFYEQPNGQPFVVQCNVSDIFPDLTVELTCGEETVRFSPFISLENGDVQPGERGLLLTLE